MGTRKEGRKGAREGKAKITDPAFKIRGDAETEERVVQHRDKLEQGDVYEEDTKTKISQMRRKR